MKYYFMVVGYEKMNSDTGSLSKATEISLYAKDEKEAIKKAKKLHKSNSWIVRAIHETENTHEKLLDKILKHCQ